MPKTLLARAKAGFPLQFGVLEIHQQPARKGPPRFHIRPGALFECIAPNGWRVLVPYTELEAWR